MVLQSIASSCGSSDASPSSSSKFSSLPIMALKKKIVEKILENRVTLIIGETGCGKSSQVPQFLLEENVVPILCTQPRRFAVVAVAKMVAKSRNCELGEEIGYHIGCSKHLSTRSKIVFKTAGVLFDEMRDKGLNALKYKVIILDEVHERSVESDLVLVCMKQFLLKNNDLRLVLMSATADISRYRDYFKELGRGERVEVLAIPSSSREKAFERKVLYIDQVTKLLGMSSELSSLASCSGPFSHMDDALIKPEEHKLIHDLILHIDRNEPDIEKSILIFLPTYYSLVQQWHLLNPFHKSFKVHILHRSLDTEQALTAMEICKSHRKVILATNIAESSVTIPKVAFVIDSCRSLQVYWDSKRKYDSTMLIWVSKSQAEQRKGRTGRTCDGEIYRLVGRSFFNKLEDYDCPTILRLSLRQQVLHICCAESRIINDPKALLQKALDPPEPEVVEEALNLLFHMNALEKTYPRGRYEPTFYGWLLASFPISFDASVLVAKFGEIGMLHEGILLGILMDTLPLPILHPFGDEHLFTEYISCYYSSDNYNNFAGKREMALIANLCAFGFWQRIFKDKHRLENLKQLMKLDEMKATILLLPKVEEEWCSLHHLVQSSLQHVSEMYEDILRYVHQFRPSFLGVSGTLPTYLHPYEFGHTCLFKCEPIGEKDELPGDDDRSDSSLENRKCIVSPFVAPNQFQLNDVATTFSNIIKEIKSQFIKGLHDNHLGAIDYAGSHPSGEVPACRYFAKGFCNMGNNCGFSHSLQAKRPICKFFLSLQGCKHGDSCFFLHDLYQLASSDQQISCLPEDGVANPASFLQLLPTSSDGCILLLDETDDMRFILNLIPYFDPYKIISTSHLSRTSIHDSSLTGVRILWGICHPYQVIISKVGECLIPWSEIKCVLWFPNPNDYSEILDRQKIIVKNVFEHLAIRILGDALYEVQVIVTMNNIKFSQLQVEKLGRDCFFFLNNSFPFDETSFGELMYRTNTNRPKIASRATSYVFELQPPADIQFGDYASVLHNILHDD